MQTNKFDGIAITQYLSPHGSVNLVKDVMLEYIDISNTSYYGGYAFAIELEDCVYRYLQTRDVQMETDIQAPGDDSYKDQYICEVGIKKNTSWLQALLGQIARRFHMSRETDLAYLAGFVDGEGCLRINKVRSKNNNGKWYFAYRPFVQITQKGDKTLRTIKKDFPESTLWKEADRDKAQNTWRLQWTGNRAIKLLMEVLPFLRNKMEQAKLMLRFQEHINSLKSSRKWGETIPEDELLWRESQIKRLSQLKRDVNSNESVPYNSVNSEKACDGNSEPSLSIQEGATTKDGTVNYIN